MSVLLYNQSCYTLLSSTLRIQQMMEFCHQNNYSSIALTEQNNMFSTMDFYKTCKKENIKPIIGLEVPVLIDEESYSFLLYAKDDIGYLELCNISSYLLCDNKALDFIQFNNLSSHLIKVSNYRNSYIYQLLKNNKFDKLKDFLSSYQNNDNFYIGIGANSKAEFKHFNNTLFDICNEYNIKPVALNLATYAFEDDFESYKVLNAIKQNCLYDDNNLKYETDSNLKTKKFLEENFDFQSIINTEEIANKCNVEMKIAKATLPHFETKCALASKDYLKQLCIAGLNKRLNSTMVPKSYVDRLNDELNTIIKMHFEDYFLIVADLIKYARNNNIYVGPGRGSAVGSLVSYCLGITHLDPIKYNLLFERFLNIERISMPDIDIDFPDDKREEMIRYTILKYGYENTAHILTFGTLSSKQVIKDVGRAMHINQNDLDLICRNILDKPKITLSYCYNNNDKFRTIINSSINYQKLFKICLKLEGLPRYCGTHASGIVISNTKLTDNIPVIKLSDKMYTTQYTMEHLEEQGLIKLDYLGLRNLTIISNISNDIKKTDKSFNILKISLNNDKTFNMIRDCNTSGIFQLESDGMRALIRKMQPQNFDDIAILIALFRPGPMQNIGLYLNNRNNPNNIHYLHKDLIPILQSTCGIMIYQEQVMQIAKTIAGFSLNEADILRKAISKKKEAELLQLKTKFVNGAKEKGYDINFIMQLFDVILKFADYGFNKSHSYGYSLIAYQLAYLKANYPLYFYKEVLNSVIGNTEKINEYIIEAKKNNIIFLPVDINKSMSRFIIENDCLRIPFTCIKNIGDIISNSIINERNKCESFIDYFSCIAHCNIAEVSKKIIENLINVGALDTFKLSRNTMLSNYDVVSRYVELSTVKNDNQISIDFDLISKPILLEIFDNKKENAKKEFNLLGFYLYGHPTELFFKQYSDAFTSKKLINYIGRVKTICLINNIKQFRTKTGDLMAFVNGEDMYGKIELAFMPDSYKKYDTIIDKGIIILVDGVINQRKSIKVNNIQVLER